MENQPIAVHCKDITKHYGLQDMDVLALRGIDLTVYAGELLMLAGPSGCGKTTLISIIAGILNQTSGSCELFGQDLTTMTEAERIQFRSKNIGFVFQAFNLFPSLTAAENVAVPLVIANMDRKRAVQRGADLLGLMGLKDKCNAFPRHLSGGQQQRIAIARALIHNPRLIVCDEPTSALDGEIGHTIMELLKGDVLDKTRALIVVTHDARIFEFADRIANMDDGRILKITGPSPQGKIF